MVTALAPGLAALPAARKLKTLTYLIEPFDLFLHSDEKGLHALQERNATFLRALDGPARLVTWHVPTSLKPLVDWTLEEAKSVAHSDPWRYATLMQYRTWYESIERAGSFQQALCGLALWTESDTNAHALGMAAQTTLGSRVIEGHWPPLLRGDYVIEPSPIWHLKPVGRPSGRPLFCMLSSYDFLSVDWNFFRPLAGLFGMGIPLGFAIDIPKTWETADSIAKLEGVITAMNAHLATSIGLDSASHRQVSDCTAALAEILDGRALHDVQIKIAIPAENTTELKKRVDEIKKQLKAAIRMHTNVGLAQITAAKYFSSMPTRQIEANPTTWPMLSNVAALMLGFLGMRKLEPKRGIIRGFNAGGGKYPYIYDDWELSQGKKATHELWVGVTGSGKTFALNCFLSRSLAHLGIPFDFLEPLGHGRLLAEQFGIEAMSISARRTKLNPHDPITDQLGQQVEHVLSIYELFLGRSLRGTSDTNMERGLLSRALNPFYRGVNLATMTPAQAPTISDVLSVLNDLGDTDESKEQAHHLVEEIAGLASGDDSPYGFFLDGKTSVDFSLANEHLPRIFCFHEMEDNDTLISIAYTQVLASIMRTAMANDNPRIIAVDEVYRMMRHPALMKFLITAVKTLRTKRKKVIAIDQQMRIFLNNPDARLLFDNCPIRVIFSQKGSEDVFYNDEAFQHYTQQHLKIISSLPRFQFMMETDEGIFFLASTPSEHELQRFTGS
jgi:hypothetical protein